MGSIVEMLMSMLGGSGGSGGMSSMMGGMGGMGGMSSGNTQAMSNSITPQFQSTGGGAMSGGSGGGANGGFMDSLLGSQVGSSGGSAGKEPKGQVGDKYGVSYQYAQPGSLVSALNYNAQPAQESGADQLDPHALMSLMQSLYRG